MTDLSQEMVKSESEKLTTHWDGMGLTSGYRYHHRSPITRRINLQKSCFCLKLRDLEIISFSNLKIERSHLEKQKENLSLIVVVCEAVVGPKASRAG